MDTQVKYQQALPIRTRLHTVWEIVLPGERHIAIWSKDATLEDVHAFYALRHDQFFIGQLGVGEYTISKIHHSYMDDGRFVDQDWNVALLEGE